MRQKLSVIIPTLNEEENISFLLNDLFAQTIKPSEIIIVDGGSEDKTIKVINKFDKVRLISKNPPVANQRNAGAEIAQNEILMFIDADVRLSADFTKRVLKNHTDRNLDISCPLYYPHNSNFIIKSIYYFFNAIFIITSPLIPSGASTVLVVNKNIFESFGGFKNMIFEDIELIRRIGKKHRYGIIYTRAFVSDRRFREYGILKTFVKYLVLSIFFTLGLFEEAKIVQYPMGKYKNSKN